MNYLSYIVESPILSPFTPKELEGMLQEGKMKITRHKKGTVLHFDGDLCDRVEIVLEGTLAIDRIDSNGNVLSVSEFHEGDILGGNIMFSSNPVYLMMVTTVEDCVLVEIRKEDIFELLSSNKMFLKAYLEFVSDLTTVLGNKIRNTIQLPLREKIVIYLKEEMSVQGSNRIILGQSKKALAERLGVQRTSLSRELQKMSKEGLIDFDAKVITILKI